DLFATFREVLGEKIEHTMRVAFYDEGWVDYVVAEVTSGPALEAAGVFERDGHRETVATATRAAGYDGSVLVQRLGTIAFPVDVDLVREDGSRQRVHWDGEAAATRIP